MTSVKKKKPAKVAQAKQQAPCATAAEIVPVKMHRLLIDSPELVPHAIAIRAIGKQTIENVILIGRHLTECKRIIGHGGFGDWLKREFNWTDRLARFFMQVFEMSKSENFSVLDLPVSSVYMLAAPSTPPEVRKEVIARASKGEKLKGADIKRAVKAAKKSQTTTAAIPPEEEQPSTDLPAEIISALAAAAPVSAAPPAPDAKGTRPRQPKPTAAEKETARQEDLFKWACVELGNMTDETRRKFFDHIEKTYPNDGQMSLVAQVTHALNRKVLALESEIKDLQDEIARLKAASDVRQQPECST